MGGRRVVGRGGRCGCRSSGDATAARSAARARAAVVPSAACQRSAPGPLAGLRVVDCSTVLAGPYCTMLLGDLGADVVKVEPPEGDATRGWGPPWVGSEADGTRTAAYYLAVNRNKRSIRLDLRHPDGAAILRRLLADADVLVENFRPGGLARLGFDDAALEALNPRLVHLAITGYGTGRPGGRPARLRLRHPGDERADVRSPARPTRTAAARRRSASRSATS